MDITNAESMMHDTRRRSSGAGRMSSGGVDSVSIVISRWIFLVGS